MPIIKFELKQSKKTGRLYTKAEKSVSKASLDQASQSSIQQESFDINANSYVLKEPKIAMQQQVPSLDSSIEHSTLNQEQIHYQSTLLSQPKKITVPVMYDLLTHEE